MSLPHPRFTPRILIPSPSHLPPVPHTHQTLSRLLQRLLCHFPFHTFLPRRHPHHFPSRGSDTAPLWRSPSCSPTALLVFPCILFSFLPRSPTHLFCASHSQFLFSMPFFFCFLYPTSSKSLSPFSCPRVCFPLKLSLTCTYYIQDHSIIHFNTTQNKKRNKNRNLSC